MAQFEFKSMPAEFQAKGDEGIYEGYFAIFDREDMMGDIFHRGAFTKSLNERRAYIKPVWGHDDYLVIGPPPEVLEEDTKGLHARGKLTISRGDQRGSFYADEAWALMKDGAISEGSIKYKPHRARTEYKDGRRHMREAVLYHISPVGIAAHPMADVHAVKAFNLEPDQAFARYFELMMGVLPELKAAGAPSASNFEKVKSAHAEMAELIALLQEMLDAATPKVADQSEADMLPDGVEPPHLAPQTILELRAMAAQAALAMAQPINQLGWLPTNK